MCHYENSSNLVHSYKNLTVNVVEPNAVKCYCSVCLCLLEIPVEQEL